MYIHKEIEKKWQAYWEKNKTFKTENDFSKPKYYTLDMFPFPSWAWLHVGHPEWMTANDIVARYKKTNGYNVLHPMGWDAFWLPAENYAIKTGTHPKITTKENIDNFRKQIKALWFSYDWDREVDTTDPKYYKWTQWIFLKLFEKWLAYEQDLPINYCPSCKTGLANEEVLNDFTCERCGTKVEKKKIRQWVLAITKYADRLEKDVDKLDWPEGIKDMQKNWIWKSEGCEFMMKKVWEENKFISVYTTRIDTVFGMTYAVVAPDHPRVFDFITEENYTLCEEYIEKANSRSDQDRTQDDKEKTWIFTGSYIINPFNWKEVPLWIWDYVLWNYGTWAVMAVPAHDTRDFAFAKKYNLEIIESISWWDINEKAFTNLWSLINSWNFDWLKSKEAQTKLIQFAEENNFWTKKVNYKLRDWLFSRQRYWGEPIPLIHLPIEQLQKLPHINNISEASDNNLAYILKRPPVNWESSCDGTTCSGMVRELIVWGKVFSKIYDGIYGKIVCDYNLPLELPEVEDFAPSGDGQSPLAKVDSFVHIKISDNLTGKRETNTMPQWGGSCWYYLRYMDPDNSDMLVDPEVEKYWGQVDSYVGWAEHAVLHLLYARFWHKFLFDIWVVSSDEPFHRLRNQGLILAHAFQRKNWWLLANDLVEEKDGKYFEIENGEEVDRIVSKMSKSLKNVVNPDDIVEEYGADSLRLYEMYIADFKDAAPWDTTGITWVRRFLEKSERLFWAEAKISTEDDNTTMKLVHKTIKKIEWDIENYKFNTAIAALMILVNNWLPKDSTLQAEWKNTFIRILHPFAPHLAEELWERITSPQPSPQGEGVATEYQSIFFSEWPKYDEAMTIDDTIIIAVQVLGKVRWTIEINKDEDKDSVLEKARTNEDVVKWLEWKEIVKEIYVPGKIVNLVVK
jgi:leucyl-tRNA synthetase